MGLISSSPKPGLSHALAAHALASPEPPTPGLEPRIGSRRSVKIIRRGPEPEGGGPPGGGWAPTPAAPRVTHAQQSQGSLEGGRTLGHPGEGGAPLQTDPGLSARTQWAPLASAPLPEPPHPGGSAAPTHDPPTLWEPGCCAPCAPRAPVSLSSCGSSPAGPTPLPQAQQVSQPQFPRPGMQDGAARGGR